MVAWGVAPAIVPRQVGFAGWSISVLSLTLVLWYLLHLGTQLLVRFRFRRVVMQDGTRGLVGYRELQLDGHWLLARTEYGVSKRQWLGMERIVDTGDYIFLYMSANQAHVVPKKKVSRGNAERFFQRAGELIAAAREAR